MKHIPPTGVRIMKVYPWHAKIPDDSEGLYRATHLESAKLVRDVLNKHGCDFIMRAGKSTKHVDFFVKKSQVHHWYNVLKKKRIQ